MTRIETAESCSLQPAHEDIQRRLAAAFWNGAPVASLMHRRAKFVDDLLIRAWRQCVDPSSPLALIAVGGYGRGELHPYSDVDLLVLAPDELTSSDKARVGEFIAGCWDLGLHVGHSIRSVSECREAARERIDVATALLEARLLTGSQNSFDVMQHATGNNGPEAPWFGIEFFHAKCAEQKARHARYHNTAYNLEPNLKEGPGGLRDMQLVSWVLKRHFKVRSLYDLIAQGFLFDDEYRDFTGARETLWTLRFALHLLAARAEERLLFDYQQALAKRLGYHDRQRRNEGVETLMRGYFLAVKRLEFLSDLLLQRYLEAASVETPPSQPFDAHYCTRGDCLELQHSTLFAQQPALQIDLFRLLACNPQIKKLGADTLRALYLHADKAQNLNRDDRAQTAFLNLLRQPRGVAENLQRMNRFGILGHYLPAFGAIVGHMQYDLFHAYTVDQHTLFVVQNLGGFAEAETQAEFKTACDVFRTIAKPELLYLAALFHDIAKGRGGDHSNLGAEEASHFCRTHGVPETDTHLVVWLVRNHLIMSHAAQCRDLSEPEVINQFAREVGDRRYLDHLYLLTVADIAATHPNLWNSWKSRLLDELYVAARYALRRGLENPIDHEEWLHQTRTQAAGILDQQHIDSAVTEAIWRAMPVDWFARLDAGRIAWQTAQVARGVDSLPLIHMREAKQLGATEVFIYTKDCKNLFANLAATFDSMNLQVLEARIFTTTDGRAWDSFLILDHQGRTLIGHSQRLDLKRRLSAAMRADDAYMQPVSKLHPRRLKHFQASLQIDFNDDSNTGRTQVAIVALDRPGLLSMIGHAFAVCDIRIHDARIATFGERAEDFFSVSTYDSETPFDATLKEWFYEELGRLLNNKQPMYYLPCKNSAH